MALEKIELKFDFWGIISIILTTASIFFSFKLSLEYVGLAVLLLIIMIFSYLATVLIKSHNEQIEEIKRLNEKVNIYRDISDLKSKIELIMNHLKRNKRGQAGLIPALIKIIQIIVILIAVYLILKALGINL